MKFPFSRKEAAKRNGDAEGTAGTQSSKIPWKTLAILSSIATLVMYAETMLIPAIPDLIKDFNISYNTSAWILTAYLVVGAIMTPVSGKLSDMYGRKKILLIVMLFYAAGVSIGGFANNFYFMIFARILQGVGISVFPIAFGIIRDEFPREKTAIGQGIISSMFAGGSVIGLAVGGNVIQHYGWQYTFFSITPVTFILVAVIWRFIHVTPQAPVLYKVQKLKEQQPTKTVLHHTDKLQPGSVRVHKDSLDIKGAICLATTVTSFLLLLTFLQTGEQSANNSYRGNTSAQNVQPTSVSFPVSGTLQLTSFLVIGIVSLVAFVLIESRVSSPLVNMKLMLNKLIFPSNIIIMTVGFSMFLIFQTIPILARNPSPLGFGNNAIESSLVQLPFAIVLLIFGPTSGFLISKVGSFRPIIAGTVISTVGFLGLMILHSNGIQVSVNLVIISTGLSLTNVGGMNVVMLRSPMQFIGISLGMTTLMRIVGSAIGPAVAGMFMHTTQAPLKIGGIIQTFPSEKSYFLIFLTATILSAVSVVLAIFLKRASLNAKEQQ